MICYNCKQDRSKFGAEVSVKGTFVGYLCKKCNRKHLVSDRPEGMGWREGFMRYCDTQIRKDVDNEAKIKLTEFMGVK